MRPDRFTEKLQQALQSAQDNASKRRHTELDNDHVLLALVQQPEGVARPLLEQIGLSMDNVVRRLEEELERRATVQGAGVTPQLGRDVVVVLEAAEQHMAKMRPS